jgi:hypothetical protein
MTIPNGPQFDHLFEKNFHTQRGITFQQAREGFVSGMSNLGRMVGAGPHEIVSPEDIDDFVKEIHRDPRSSDIIKGAYPLIPRREQAGQRFEEKRPIEDVVHDWTMDHTGMNVGEDAAVARDLTALSNEIRGGRTPTAPIYRGQSGRETLGSNRDFPVSFTEDRHVARAFAAAPNSGRGGQVIKLPPGAASGLFVPDYVKRERTVGSGRRPEREWLIDPRSINTRT